MEFKTSKNGQITHVKMVGKRLDASQVIAFKEGIQSISDAGADHILLDMEAVEFMDSSGLGALVAVLKYLGSDKKFAISGLSPMVEKVFQLTRMDQIFCIYKSAKDAVSDQKFILASG